MTLVLMHLENWKASCLCLCVGIGGEYRQEGQMDCRTGSGRTESYLIRVVAHSDEESPALAGLILHLRVASVVPLIWSISSAPANRFARSTTVIHWHSATRKDGIRSASDSTGDWRLASAYVQRKRALIAPWPNSVQLLLQATAETT